MYCPIFRKNAKAVPILSKHEINIIAETFAQEFMPQILTQPQPFDIEGFIEIYLQLQLDYQYLSNDGRYLGMTVFNDTNKVPVYFPHFAKADFIHAASGTVIIDTMLLNEKQEHRYRYTLGHESGHWIFHNDYFGYNPDQLTLFDKSLPYIQCRKININYIHTSTRDWDETRWMEWQADIFSAALLMPKTSVQLLIDKTNAHCDEIRKISLISDVFNVSEQAAYLRLCELGYIKQLNDDSIYEQLSFL